MKCSRRIRPIVSTVSIPPTARFESQRAAHRPTFRGSILDADPPAQGVKIARRNTVICELLPESFDDTLRSEALLSHVHRRREKDFDGFPGCRHRYPLAKQ